MARLPRKITLTAPNGNDLAVYTINDPEEAAADASRDLRSLVDRAKAAYADDRDADERKERLTTRKYQRMLTDIFTWRCTAVLDVDETTIEGVATEVLNNGQRFVATGQVDGMSFEVVAHRGNLAETSHRSVAFRDKFPLRVILPCTVCNGDRAFYIESLADLGKVLADQRCTECGGSIMSALPGYLAVR